MAEFFFDYEEIISMRSYGYRIIRQASVKFYSDNGK